MKTMKMNKYFSMAALGALALTFGSCENEIGRAHV